MSAKSKHRNSKKIDMFKIESLEFITLNMCDNRSIIIYKSEHICKIETLEFIKFKICGKSKHPSTRIKYVKIGNIHFQKNLKYVHNRNIGFNFFFKNVQIRNTGFKTILKMCKFEILCIIML